MELGLWQVLKELAQVLMELALLRALERIQELVEPRIPLDLKVEVEVESEPEAGHDTNEHRLAQLTRLSRPKLAPTMEPFLQIF